MGDSYDRGSAVTDIEPVPVSVLGSIKVDTQEYEIIGHGYTLEPGNFLPFQILAEDPTRVRAFITTNQLFWMGDKQQMMSANNPPSTGSAGPGARMVTGTSFMEVHAQNEIWGVPGTATLSLGVWVERRIPRR